MPSTAKVMLSAVQPTSTPHLGNYLGAIKNWVTLQPQYQCLFFAVDLHAITLPKDPAELRADTYKVFAYYLACGIDPERAILFCQSHVAEHAELAWVLNCFTYLGELSRMHQFKDKSARFKDSSENGAREQSIGAGILNYPVLMAADILLYQVDYVPVGDDQKQHLELTRNLAERLNNRFQQTLFKIPEPLIQKSASRVMDLQDPTNKMSKSSPHPKGVLFLDDSDAEILKKIKSAVTDSDNQIELAETKPGLRNLIEINAALTSRTPQAVVEEFAGKMYGHLKVATAELAVTQIRPIREKARDLLNHRDYLDSILHNGAEKARTLAQGTLRQVYDVLGFLPKR